MRAKDAGTRCRCKVVLALVQGKTPTMIAQGGLCAKSQVYRVAERFITEGLAGLADRREDNGERKITDEVDIHLNPKIGPDWTKRGRQKMVLTPGCNEGAYLAGAWNPKTRAAHLCRRRAEEQPAVPGTAPHVGHEGLSNARKRIHLILDNYGIHDRLQVRLAMKSAAAEKLGLHFLPPYCPDHNRIERIWKDLHDNVTRNHRCTTMDELMADVRNYLAARNRRGRHTYARTKVA